MTILRTRKGRYGQPVQAISVAFMEELSASGKAKCKIIFKLFKVKAVG